MLHLAYFSPLPPQHTGIADYSADLLPALADMCDVTLFVDNPGILSDTLTHYQVAPMHTFPERRWDFDMALYQMGNSHFHASMYRMALRYPGVVVLHDYTLHHLIATLTVGAGNFARYQREMAYARGLEGLAKAQSIATGAPTPLFSWPLNDRLVDASIGLLVHSRFVYDKLLATHPLARVAEIGQPLPLPAVRERVRVRAALGIPDEAFVVLTCGSITPEKRLDVVLAAFQQFLYQCPDALWVIAGEPSVDIAGWHAQLQAADLGDCVRQVGYIDGLETFYDYLSASDVCVNLRFPTAGETSASVLRAMAIGTPVIVSDIGWYAELPDSVCARIVHDGTEVSQLTTALMHWQVDAGARLAAGHAARAYVEQMCDPARIAGAYVDFIDTSVHI